MTERRMSKVEKENKEALESLYKGEWASATEFERGQAWFKLNLVITDSQPFPAEFLNGYLEEERNYTMNFFKDLEESKV